jgi:hypothetical protein
MLDRGFNELEVRRMLSVATGFEPTSCLAAGSSPHGTVAPHGRSLWNRIPILNL